MRPLQRQGSKRDSGLLTSRESTNQLQPKPCHHRVPPAVGCDVPCQTRNPKRAKMRTVLELTPPRELGCEEGDSAHGRYELIDVVLSEVGPEHRSVRDHGGCERRTFVVGHCE